MRLIDEPAFVRRATGVVAVTGEDRHAFLHSMLSQDIEHLAPGQAADFLFLDAKGGARAAGRALVVDGEVLLAVPGEIAADLAATLANSTFLMQATAEHRERWTLASARGPGRLELAGAPEEAMRATTQAPYALRDRSGGVDLLGDADAVESVLAASGLAEAGAEDWQAWRIDAGQPEWGAEIAAGRRSQELGLLPTHVHLAKGCYPGQESIAKTYNLGRPRRALCLIDLDGPADPGDAVQAGDKAGEVTSAAPLEERWVALAMVPLTRDGSLLGDGEVAVGASRGHVRRRVGEGLPLPGA